MNHVPTHRWALINEVRGEPTVEVLRRRFFKAFKEKNSVQRYLARRVLFPLLEPLGFHIVGDHFYEPIPNLRSLKNSYKDAPRLVPNATMDFRDAEATHIKRLAKYGREFRAAVKRFEYTERNRYLPIVDAISLYCFLRERKTLRVVEVGQGVSTRVILAALAKNRSVLSSNVEFVSIDPYDRLGALMDVRWVDAEFIQRPVQSTNPSELVGLLGGGALLFVDSSHVFKPGSDVEYLMKEVYPRVPHDTYIHIHDIYTPYPRPLGSYLQRCFWNEQDHLESFLSFNDSFRVELPLFWLLRDSKGVNERLNMLEIERSGWNGASFYIRRTR